MVFFFIKKKFYIGEWLLSCVMVKEGFRTDGFLVGVIVSIVAVVAMVLLVANISDWGESSVVGFKIAPSNMVSSKDSFNPKEVNEFMNCVFDYSKSCRVKDRNKDGVVKILKYGADKARAEASVFLALAKKNVGLNYDE